MGECGMSMIPLGGMVRGFLEREIAEATDGGFCPGVGRIPTARIRGTYLNIWSTRCRVSAPTPVSLLLLISL